MAAHLRLASAAQFCSTVRPASASAACQLGVPNTIWKPVVVLLATKYVWLAAARSAVSIEQAGLWGCRQHLLCDNGGDGADIAGAFGKQQGVTVLEGKWHGARITPLSEAEADDPCRAPWNHPSRPTSRWTDEVYA